MARAKPDDQFEEDSNGLIDQLGAKLGTAVKRPANVAWSVGGLVAVGFVFSNALFFQSGTHPAAFFETRAETSANDLQADELELPLTQDPTSGSSQTRTTEKPVTRIVFDQAGQSEDQTAALPVVERRAQIPAETISGIVAETEAGSDLNELQNLLAQLNFYDGELDGLDGPKTRAAIEAYKANVGLRGIELTYAELATSARNNLIVTAAIPKARPSGSQEPQPKQSQTVGATRYTPPRSTIEVETASTNVPPSNTVGKVQAGLRAFGNQSVTVDGVAGSQTSAAIKEFQSLFKLPVTGQIDKQLIDKMVAVGLINR